MENSPKNSDSVLVDNDSKSMRVLAGLNNITNKPLDATVPAKPGLSVIRRDFSDKENPVLLDKNSKNIDADAAPSSLRKPALPGPQKEQMEHQLDLLQGKLHSIRRESLRPSIIGHHQGSAPSISTRAAPLAIEAPAAADNIGSLAAKLESLKRETARPSYAATSLSNQPTAVHLDSATAPGQQQHDSTTLSRLAQQLFNDKEFIALCEKGMHAQLTRTKDGATEETKIKELASIVKMLRRAMKEIQQRTQMYIDHTVRFEKEAAQQVESVKLSSESTAMAAHAELANARREAASAAANHKAALATWQGEIDMHRSEAATLRREMERIESERDRAKEEIRRVETARAALEDEIKDVRKSQAQRERELQVDKNSAAQMVFEAKEAAERQRAVLSESLASAEARCTEAEATCAQLKERLLTTEEKLAVCQEELAKASEQRDALASEKESLNEEVADLREHVTSQRSMNEKLTTDGAAALSEIGEWQQKAANLLAELEKERALSSKHHAEAVAVAEAAEAERAAWAASKQEFERVAAEAQNREEELSKERNELKAALDAATEKRSEADTSAQEAKERVASLQEEIESLTARCDELSTEAVELRRSEAEARERAAGADANIARIAKEAEEKANKLAQLEGELEALQECTVGLQVGDQKELLNRMVTKIATLEAAVASAEARRREAHNQLVELKGNIRVFCRIRPHPRAIATVGSDGSSVRISADNKDHVFSFDRVFKPAVSQAAVFEEVADVVQSALDGYKVCLFSYGQTGAGKTHTMQGNTSSPGQEGIIPRSISKILATVARLRDQGWEYTLEASYIEVYNEQLRDLLGAGRITESNAIQHGPNSGHTTVLGATRAAIASEEDADELVRRAAASRAVESTAMNAESSRSHSVFMLYITGRHEATETLLQGSLNLVDLAGSERLNRSQAEGQRAREACSINKSLSALGDVFAALAAKQPHVPYRNSKLTHLLQPCLGGSGKTLMFVNINPEPDSAGESLCSLRFAAKVNQCETAAKGGAQRSVAVGGGDGFAPATANSFSTEGRPSLTGRASVAPSSMATRRQSVAPSGAADRRASMIPSAAGTKRRATGPPVSQSGTSGNGAGASRVARPKLG